ncbi:MerR family transcriptional regulator [Sandaracinobacteroides saxicola]|uniref:MerR family transcriptional regulator n=1 Tax=Sandaracinobacteroides saxicola TaxID=2759707 RepID=A0A7G5IK44_9SPHN|nr:MerR family transcriptional regulator [Sandaracinobacteroides saxicola]QMW23736.1 MerR family transcriptional regulator [Sandaracinobacteroides saxicola]
MTDKSDSAFRTIREVSESLGVPQHVLRFWETRFPQLKPLQRGGNRRYYRPADVALAAALHRLLHSEGYTVKGVQKLIATKGVGALSGETGAEPAAEPVPPGAGGVDLAALRAVRDRLAAALAA